MKTSNRLASAYSFLRRRPRLTRLGILTLACLTAASLGSIFSGSSWWPVTAAGRLHPLVVHLPIGFLIAGALLELAAMRWKQEPLRRAALALLAGGAVAASAAVSAGFMLSEQGAYDEIVLERHETLGIAVLLLSLFAVAVGYTARRRSRFWERLYGGTLAALVLSVVLAGHYGGSLTHGSGYLTDQLPPSVQALFGLKGAATALVAHGSAPEESAVYPTLVQPILTTHCVSCHGPNKQEGDLRLDEYQALMMGGEGGPAVIPGKPSESELVRRIVLPANHEDHMPPGGRRPLTVAEADLLRWWIEIGAPEEAKVQDLEWPPPMRPLMTALGLNPLERKTGILALQAPPVDEEALAAGRAAGWRIEPLADEVGFLDVQPAGNRKEVRDEHLDVILPLAENVAWLDLKQTGITDAAVKKLARFPHLVRLRLDHTSITGTTLRALADLKYLTYLNLYASEAGDDALEQVQALTALESIYLWRSAATSEAVAQLRKNRPDLAVHYEGPHESVIARAVAE